MKNILLIYISLLYINHIKTDNDINPNLVVISFKTYHYPQKGDQENFSSKEYMDIIHSSLLYLKIETGKGIKQEEISKEIESKFLDNKQYLNLFIIMNDYKFYIDDNYFYTEDKKKFCQYSSYFSTSYDIDKEYNISKDYKGSIIANDYFKIYNDKNMEKYIFMKMDFRHSLNKENNINFSCGMVGLLIPTNKLFIESKTNFINQLHQHKKNIDYSFSFQYNKQENFDQIDDGILIIGEESLYKKGNNDLNPIYMKQKTYGSKLEWEFDINQVCIGTKLLEFDELDTDIIINCSIEGIQIPYFFYQELNEIFFNKYYSKSICKYELINNHYIIISCNADQFNYEDIKNFPEINFLKYKIGFNFTFTGNDLFIKKGDKYFFKMVAYFEKFLKKFDFGRIFLKKYKVIFNSDSKAMYFFDENKKFEDGKGSFKDNKNMTFISFSYIFIGILFLALGIFFGRKFCISRRKIYANELEDDNYVYESKNKNIQKENKLIDF